MSVVVAGGEKLVETPSVSGESVVEVQPFPPMKDQVVVRGWREAPRSHEASHAVPEDQEGADTRSFG